jgi:hypothetical protein
MTMRRSRSLGRARTNAIEVITSDHNAVSATHGREDLIGTVEGEPEPSDRDSRAS